MKKLILFCITLTLFLSCEKTNQNSIGNNQQAVQDFAQLFSDSENENLTKKIIDFKNTSSTEICIYTIDSLPENIDYIDVFASKIAYEIGIDTEEKNNGLLILISEHDTEFTFVIGKETKKTFTDSIRKNISENNLIPYFSKNEYFQGVDSTLDAVISLWEK